MIGCFFARKPPPEVGFLLRVLDCSDLLVLAELYGEARDGLNSPVLMDAVNKRMAEVIRASKPSAAALSAEPVASIYVTEGGDREFDDWKVPLLPGRNLLYAAPQPAAQERKPLTPDGILEIQEKYVGCPTPSYPLGQSDWIEFARAIERAHGITGEPK